MEGVQGIFQTDISEINTILSDNEIPIIIQIVDKTLINF